MSTFVVPINDYANGSVVGGGDWTNPIATSGNALTVAGTSPNKTLTISGATTGTHIFAYTPVGSNNDVEVLVKFKLASDVGKQGIVSLRYSGNSEASTVGYTLSGSFISSAGQLAIDEGSTGYVVWTPWNYLPNIVYWARFRINGTSLRAKVWTDGGSEPGWMIDTTNSIVSSGSYSGLHQYRGSNVEYTWASFGTAGDPAPTIQPVKTQTGNFRVQTTVDKTQTGNFRIQTTNTKIQQGNFRVTATTDRTQVGNFDVLRTTDRTQQGNFRVAISSSQTQQGNFRVQTINDKVQVGNFDIIKTITRTQTGDFRVAVEYLKTQVGNFSITIPTPKTQVGNFRIQRTETKTQVGNFDVWKQIARDQVGNFNVRQTITKTQVGNFVIAREYLREQIGNFRIVKGRSYEDTPRILSKPVVVNGNISGVNPPRVGMQVSIRAGAQVNVGAKPSVSVSGMSKPILR